MKKYITFILVFMMIAVASVSCFAAATQSLVVDNAGLLSETERQSLEARLSEISDKYSADIVVVTENYIGNATPTEYADDFFDYNGYGRGENRDGALLLISMEDRDWYVSTSGSCIDSINYSIVGRRILSDLSDGDYYDAFMSYADICEKMLDKSSSGDGNYSDSDYSREYLKYQLPKLILISLVIGMIISFLIMTKYTKQLKTVCAQNKADSYVVKDSLDVKVAKDIFLYRTVSRVRRQTESNSGGGGTHTSSSGSSHGGGGGKF